MYQHYKLTLSLLLFPLITWSQNDIFNSTRFTQKDGLASYNIKCLQQDKYGFLWIGTQDGISFYDGTGFKLIKNNDNSSAVDVRNLLYDKKRNLMWVAYTFGGVQAFDCSTHQPVITLSPAYSRNITQQSNIKAFEFIDPDRILIALNRSYFVYHINSRKEDPIVPFVMASNAETEISQICITAEHVFIFVNKAGIFLLDKKNLRTPSLFHTDLQSSYRGCRADSGKLWFSLSSGLFSIDLLKQKINAELSLQDINAINLLSQDTLLLSTPAGCQLYNQATHHLSRFRYKSNMDNQSQYNLSSFMDSNGHLWLGFSEFLLFSDLTKSPFYPHPFSPGIKNIVSHLYSILPVSKSSYYLSDLNGLIYYNSDENKAYFLDKSSSIPTYLKNYSDEYLVYNTLKGFRALHKSTRSVLAISAALPEFKKIETRVIEKWLDLNDSVSILSGSDKKGLIIRNNKKHTVREIQYNEKRGWRDNIVNDLARINDEEILICQDKNIGVYNVRKDTIINYILQEPRSRMPASLYMSCLILEDRYIFLAYGHGVFVTDRNFKPLYLLNTNNGLSNNGVYGVLRDSLGYLWVSSNFGLSRINLKNLKINNYFEEDGLQNNAFEENSFIRSRNKLFFGGINGFTEVRPENITSSKLTPKVFLTHIRLISNTIDTTITTVGQQFVSIPKNINQTYIYFACDNLINAQRNRYLYKLDGLQNNWTDLGNENKVSLIDIKPGKHTLRIKAINSFGNESVEELRIAIYSEPKWYQTWWFQTLSGLAIVSLIYSFYRLRINQLKKEQRIRTKLASDLHDDLGSTMNSVNLYANLAIMEYPNGKYPPLIKESTQEAITGIRDMIWVLDDRKDSVEDLLLRINNFATPLCEAAAIQYIQDISDTIRSYKLGQEEKRNLYMMLKETINNAIKYAGSPGITLAAFLTKSKPVFEISDQGKGFNSSIASEGNGLKNLKHRTAAIKYKLHITSTPGKGTLIRFEKE